MVSRLYKQLFSTGGSNFSTSISAISNGVSLPVGTINVLSTAGFPTSGTIIVVIAINGSTTQFVNETVTYTNITATTFTGCSGGSGAMATGNLVVAGGTILNGTWLCPAGVKYVIVTGCGGGGGGGGGASSGGRANTSFAGGGSGGQASPTVTQIVQVTPGVIYNVSLGEGGVGGPSNCVANLVAGGGQRPGNAGSDGASSVFGSIVFTGGRGGREGSLVTLASMTFPAGSDCLGTPLSGSTNPNPQNIQFAATVPTFSGTGYFQGLAHVAFRATGQYSISGGGTSGGTSNNVYSFGGGGGDGAQGFDGNNFSTPGSNGSYGGGGGGGGGGENWDFNNTNIGSSGGNGGAGFIEIAWII